MGSRGGRDASGVLLKLVHRVTDPNGRQKKSLNTLRTACILEMKRSVSTSLAASGHTGGNMRPGFRRGFKIFSGLCIVSLVCFVGCNGCNSSHNSGGNNGTGTGSGGGGTTPTPGAVQVLTYHDDNMRSGQNTQETALTAANVNSTTFGKVGFDSVDGKVDAEPLYVPGVTIGGVTHNVLYVVTEHDSAYAFDADTGTQLWHVSVLGANETTSDARNCSQVMPEIGITSTPVIDPKAGAHGTIYMVAASKDSSGNYHQRLHALDLTTGAEVSGSPVTIAATYPSMGPESSNGQVVFDPKQYNERAGLLLLNGVAYLGWSSHCDYEPYTGWLMGYNENSLAQTTVLNLTPNGSEGSIWQSGAGPAADSSGNIYFLDANGSFGTSLKANGMHE